MFLNVLLVGALCASLTLAGNICYFPNGDTSSDVPCDPDALFSTCCGTRDACLSNGLCALEATDDSGISYARGSCTDKSWSSSLCPQQCQLNQDTAFNSSAYDFRASGVQIWECDTQGYGKQAHYCCESEAEKQRCCSTSTAVFQLAAATIGPFTGTMSSTSVVTSSATSSPSFLSMSISSSSAPRMGTPVETRPSSTSAPSSTASTAATDSTQRNNNTTKIGAGVGGAVGGCVLLAAVILLFRWEKNRHDRIVAGLRQQQLGELPSDDKVTYGYNPYAVAPVEADATKPRHELPTQEWIHELPERKQYPPEL